MSAKESTVFDRVVMVTRKTQLDELVEQFATVPQARFYLEHAGRDFEAIQQSHDTYLKALEVSRAGLPDDLKVHRIDRSMVPQFDFAKGDIVMAIGQDGLVSNTAKYLDGQLLVGINPDPGIYEGVLLPFEAGQVRDVFRSLASEMASVRSVTLGQLQTTDGQKLLAFNDFFIGASSHVSARYEIEWKGKRESQSSSGIIVSTGAGSTGWLRSVYQGVAGVMDALGSDIVFQPPLAMPWDTEHLVFSVREPFPGNGLPCNLVYGCPDDAAPLIVRSNMASGGVAFSDGIESDAISFNAGSELSVSVSQKSASLVASLH